MLNSLTDEERIELATTLEKAFQGEPMTPEEIVEKLKDTDWYRRRSEPTSLRRELQSVHAEKNRLRMRVRDLLISEHNEGVHEEIDIDCPSCVAVSIDGAVSNEAGRLRARLEVVRLWAKQQPRNMAVTNLLDYLEGRISSPGEIASPKSSQRRR